MACGIRSSGQRLPRRHIQGSTLSRAVSAGRSRSRFITVTLVEIGHISMLDRTAVVAGAGVQLALGAQHLVVQVVALEVADHPAIEVDLVQVTAAVLQVVDGTLVGQGQGFEVAQFIVVVFQFPGSAGFAEQLSVLVVVERQRLLLAVEVGEGDR